MWSVRPRVRAELSYRRETVSRPGDNVDCSRPRSTCEKWRHNPRPSHSHVHTPPPCRHLAAAATTTTMTSRMTSLADSRSPELRRRAVESDSWIDMSRSSPAYKHRSVHKYSMLRVKENCAEIIIFAMTFIHADGSSRGRAFTSVCLCVCLFFRSIS